MPDLVSTAPAIFTMLLGLLQTAGAEQSPAVPVFSFALTQDEPAAYVLLSSIENHTMKPRTLGNFGQDEKYDITGIATVWSGSATPDDPTVTTDVMTQTYSLFGNVVMGAFVTNRIELAGGTLAGLPWKATPGYARYSASPGVVGGGQAGWAGLIEFSFHFEAQIFPS